MQQRKFFLKRLRTYLAVFLLPVITIIVVISVVQAYTLSGSLSRKGKNQAEAVTTNLNLALSNLVQQNSLFANNPYMVLSLKRILENGNFITYADAINARSINATLKSTLTTYDYVLSVYLYLDGYDYYYTSSQQLNRVQGTEGWYRSYQEMDSALENEVLVLKEDRDESGEERILTILQRIPYYSGVLVMRIDLDRYRDLLDRTVGQKDMTTVLFNDQGKKLFTWGGKDTSSFASAADLPAEKKDGRWETIGGRKYLIHREKNDTFQVLAITLIPFGMLQESLFSYLPTILLLLGCGIAAVLICAYVTTRQNFHNIENIITVLDKAERGIAPDAGRNRKHDDEYGVILSNIIRLHLQAEQLNAELQNKKHMQEVASLSALQAQINPHFMFNTLQMIQFEAARGGEKAAKVVRMTGLLSDILKYALADPMQTIRLEEEICYLRKYVEIQHMRFGDHFILYYEVDESLDELPVYRLMLQPLIENAISHGVRDKEERGYIKLTIQDRGDTVHFSVFDTGVGMTREKLSAVRRDIDAFNVHNIGLANVNNRLKLYYGESAGLRIRSVAGQGTIVDFTLTRTDIEKSVTNSKNLQPLPKKAKNL